MDKPIRFTNHARQKFVDLANLGFVVTEAQVLDTVRDPSYVDTSVDPPIAQKPISDRHLIRVVFVEAEDEIRIVTFYPARRERYDPDDAL
jgi:hypothetical protein